MKILYLILLLGNLSYSQENKDVTNKDLRPFFRSLAAPSRAPQPDLFPSTSELSIVIFLADWCSYCKEEIPTVSRLLTEYKRCGLNIFGVALETSDINLKALTKQNRVSFPIVQDYQSHSRNRFQIKALPHFLVLNNKGEQLTKLSGTKEIDNFYSAIHKTIKTKKCRPP